MAKKSYPSELPAIINKQWLESWNQVAFDPKAHRAAPPKHMYLFSIKASVLRKLSGINRRSTNETNRSKDLGIQRRHDEERSEEIGKYVEFGYPWSDLSEVKRKSGEFNDLKKPGWLPTAVLVNILLPNDIRQGRKTDSKDLIIIKDSKDKIASISLPTSFNSSSWSPKGLAPIEVIDGQHRLWAFEDNFESDDYEIPVVAFHGLDLSWQAYLFWTINIRPKRINQSFAFDLYPLLRTEDWLEKFEGHSIYRETRAQELTEKLWSYDPSPWKGKINMLGESGVGGVTQAAWVRSLLATFIKSWEGKGKNVGGIFGAPVDGEALPWTRNQQAAFLIEAWNIIFESVEASKSSWAKEIKQPNDKNIFFNKFSMINTDQGVRGILGALNDILYLQHAELDLNEWEPKKIGSKNEEVEIKDLIKTMKKFDFYSVIVEFARAVSTFDWRLASTPGLTENERRNKLIYKGSTGYKEIKLSILKQVSLSSKTLKEFSDKAHTNAKG